MNQPPNYRHPKVPATCSGPLFNAPGPRPCKNYSHPHLGISWCILHECAISDNAVCDDFEPVNRSTDYKEILRIAKEQIGEKSFTELNKLYPAETKS